MFGQQLHVVAAFLHFPSQETEGRKGLDWLRQDSDPAHSRQEPFPQPTRESLSVLHLELPQPRALSVGAAATKSTDRAQQQGAFPPGLEAGVQDRGVAGLAPCEAEGAPAQAAALGCRRGGLCTASRRGQAESQRPGMLSAPYAPRGPRQVLAPLPQSHRPGFHVRCAGRSDKSGYWDAVPGGRPQPWMPGNRLTLIRGNSKAIPTVHPLWQADFRNAVWNTALLPGLGLWIFFYFLILSFLLFCVLSFPQASLVPEESWWV